MNVDNNLFMLNYINRIKISKKQRIRNIIFGFTQQKKQNNFDITHQNMQPEQQDQFHQYQYTNNLDVSSNTIQNKGQTHSNIYYKFGTVNKNQGMNNQTIRLQQTKKQPPQDQGLNNNMNTTMQKQKCEKSNTVSHSTRENTMQFNGKIQQKILSPSSTLNKIIQWRRLNQAPVDTMGCQVLQDKNQSLEIQKYQILIALILSVQTKDQTTAKVMQRLKKYGLRPNIMANMEQQALIQLIRQSNFNKRKAKSIIQASKKIQKFGLPRTKQQLMEFHGVGTKIALLYMRTAEGINDGIGVDTHVHRISSRLGWTKNAKTPLQTQQQLQKLFPKSEWNDINLALVGFGQVLCSAKKPLCLKCPVNLECPSSQLKYKQMF